jgi:hypothetical protein
VASRDATEKVVAKVATDNSIEHCPTRSSSPPHRSHLLAIIFPWQSHIVAACRSAALKGTMGQPSLDHLAKQDFEVPKGTAMAEQANKRAKLVILA